MLEQLTIDQIAIIEHSEIPFRPGYNVLTGETGAGKSILIDALGLVLGERADASSIRHGQARATVSATFSELSSAHQQALAEDGLDDPDNPGQIHIRRTLRDGGSKAWVNDQSVTGSKLKTLAATLVNIHGQHHNQALLKNDEQRRRLDRYANHRELLTACANAYRHWQHLEKEHEAWQNALPCSPTSSTKSNKSRPKTANLTNSLPAKACLPAPTKSSPAAANSPTNCATASTTYKAPCAKPSAKPNTSPPSMTTTAKPPNCSNKAPCT